MKRIPEYSKTDAFTLAETLITLAIIGIVAAMTIPTLMTKFFDKAMESKYKKVKSSLINGYKMMLQREEADDVADLPLVRCNKNNTACFDNQHSGIFAGMKTDVGTLPEKYYLSDGTTESPFDWNDVPYIFTTRDGAVIGVLPDDGLESFSVFADLNGNDEPNVQGKDLYKFRVSKDAVVTDVSNELINAANAGGCSIEHPELCTTREACAHLGSDSSGNWHGDALSVTCYPNEKKVCGSNWNSWSKSCEWSCLKNYVNNVDEYGMPMIDFYDQYCR